MKQIDNFNDRMDQLGTFSQLEKDTATWIYALDRINHNDFVDNKATLRNNLYHILLRWKTLMPDLKQGQSSFQVADLIRFLLYSTLVIAVASSAALPTFNMGAFICISVILMIIFGTIQEDKISKYNKAALYVYYIKIMLKLLTLKPQKPDFVDITPDLCIMMKNLIESK